MRRAIPIVSMLASPGALIAAALLTTTGCGLPLPTDGGSDCGRSVYIEKGAHIDCKQALAWVSYAEGLTGIGLADKAGGVVEFMAGDTLAELGHPDWIGDTRGKDVAVVALAAASLVHEAYHVRDGQNDHCGWSAPSRLAIFETGQVPGEYTDECSHVGCSGHFQYNDVQGQLRGRAWNCEAIP